MQVIGKRCKRILVDYSLVAFATQYRHMCDKVEGGGGMGGGDAYELLLERCISCLYQRPVNRKGQ